MLQILDNLFGKDELAAAIASWPAPDWPGWIRYDSPLERKRVCPDWRQIPPACARLLAMMPVLLRRDTDGLVADTQLYGGGLCEMTAGDYLGMHLDHDRHPLLGLRRRLNAVLFVTWPWHVRNGGELELWAPDRTTPEVRVLPAPGRLVLFDPEVPHAVAPVQPGAPPRRTLAMYFYGHPWTPVERATRPRARFVPVAGEQDDLDDLREQRAVS